MQYGYVIKISNKQIYREIQLPIDIGRLKIGLGIDCDVRFYKEQFFEDFELVFFKSGEQWQVACSDNIYIDEGDVRKLVTKKLNHGDSFALKYQSSESELFKVDFLFDFDNENKDYERIIDINGINAISIGSAPNCHIVLKSQYVKNDFVELRKTNKGLLLQIKSTTYGIYVNGKRAANGEIIKNFDFFSIAEFSFYYKGGKIYTSKKVTVNGLNYFDDLKKNNYPKFNRNTRIKIVLDDEKIEVLDPPAKPQKQKNNILQRLLPSLGMILVCILMATMGSGKEGGTSIAMFAMSGISGVMAIITSVIAIINSKKEFKQQTKERIEKYTKYIDNKKNEIQQFRNKEKNELDEIFINQDLIKKEFGDFSSDLFDRVPEDDDFLSIRLGTGAKEATKEVSYKKQEKLEVEDELQEMPEKISNDFKYLPDAPITVDMKELNAIGIIGRETCRYDLFKNIVLDICARQYHSDVSLFLVCESKNFEKLRWVRLLPHIYNESIGIRNIVCDDDSKNILFEYLYKELTHRKENKGFTKRLVVFLYDEFGFKSHPVSKFVEEAKDLGVSFVFFADIKADIAQGCDYLIDIADGKNSAKLIDTKDKNSSYDFSYQLISDEQIAAIAKLLAPVYTEEISLEGSLTKNISLFKLLNILTVDDIDLSANWGRAQVFKSMAAPLGVSKSGVVELDLHDKAHGPHGLVAGTTGSGKSEILQTYILSMATLFHPYEVGFVIIDFKGGGMVNQFENLPHLVGAITNIDGKEIDRSLKSIKAELQKRQRYFAEAEVNHIDKYIQKYKAGEVAEPLPHLILIVDEFAELKAEQPEFMKELISAARIGRSLGVHLILATQKPSGQVNEQIWSNSRFKLCLKVQDQQDSNEVIKSPLAAEIKEPGRAYLQVGNNEIFELFQSAYSGAPEKADNSNIKEFKIFALNNSGRRIPVFEQKKPQSKEGNLTQLDAIVQYVHNYCENMHIQKLPDICLPSLGKVIGFPKNDELISSEYSIISEIGVFDDPDNQYQGTYSVDLTNQNVMLIGSSQSGKTNILQTMIRSLATKYSPSEVNIYIIDFASMVLKNFEPLNHVGGVVTSSEDEKLKNLMKLLFTEIETRKEKLMSVGVSSFSAYKESGASDLPQIVVMIDNLTALKQMYFEDDEELLYLCREGLSVGITVVIANSQTAGIGYKYLSNFSAKIALFCNDSSEYGSLFEHCRQTIDDIHGRCIVEIDKTHLDCQAFLAFEGEKEINRVNQIKQFIDVINSKNTQHMAKIIPVIPEVLTGQYVLSTFGGYMAEKYSLVIGLDYASVSPQVIQLNNLPSPLALTGGDGQEQKNFLTYIVSMLNNKYKENAKVYMIDGINRQLAALKDLDIVQEYEFLTDKSSDILKGIEQELSKRYDALASGADDVIANSELIVLIINNPEALDFISNDMSLMDTYKNIITRYKNLNVCVLVGDYENTNVSYAAPDLVKMLRDARHFLYFDDISNMKIIDFPLAVMREFKKPIDTGDAYYIKDNDCYKIKTVR
ncbi:MAG: type VII secretion protein EssC [Ruminococcaceae bacterium]|nr:type VII secretion protein EssC [Oscillospiraceae bacterium]